MAVDKSRFPPEVTDVYRPNALVPGAMTAMINYYRANTDVLAGGGRAPPVIDVPTLMIWGEEDTALGYRVHRGLRIPRPRLHARIACQAFLTGCSRKRPRGSTRSSEAG